MSPNVATGPWGLRATELWEELVTWSSSRNRCPAWVLSGCSSVSPSPAVQSPRLAVISNSLATSASFIQHPSARRASQTRAQPLGRGHYYEFGFRSEEPEGHRPVPRACRLPGILFSMTLALEPWFFGPFWKYFVFAHELLLILPIFLILYGFWSLCF